MVAPAPVIARASGADFDALLALFDAEFIFGRGRSQSLQQRFPELFDRAQPQHFLQARVAGRVVSALAVRNFTWTAAQRDWRAAMIGMVCTAPEWRGKGMAGALMREAQAQMEREGLDFAALWAAQPDFYSRLGWTGADCGMLGEIECAAADASQAVPPPDAASIAFAEALRARHAPERAGRSAAAYAKLLPHAERLELLRGDSAYAIVGCNEAHGYLYELLGEPGEFPALWAGLARRYRKLFLNVGRGSPAERFLSTQAAIRWQPQKLAMWLPFTAEARGAPFAGWYVPFLDRI